MHWKDLEAPAASNAGRDPFAFDLVPVRARKDGWTAERQRRFVALLAAGCGPSKAIRRLLENGIAKYGELSFST